MIEHSAIEAAGYEIMKKAAIDIPEDYLAGIKESQKTETNTLSGYVIKTMLDNYDAATDDRRPMCADTGLPRYYVKIGDNAPLNGGFTSGRLSLMWTGLISPRYIRVGCSVLTIACCFRVTE